MFVLKIDLPTGIAYFTGKKKVVLGCESPGLTGNIEGARFFTEEKEAAKFCKMLVKKYDMEFYYTLEGKSAKPEPEPEPEQEKNKDDDDDFIFQLDKNILANVLDSEDEPDNNPSSDEDDEEEPVKEKSRVKDRIKEKRKDKHKGKK